MKILIAADMEGVTGVVSWDQVDTSTSEYQRFRRVMTGEVNAAVRGVCEGGATEVVVADGHSGGRNILVEELDERARLNSGTAAPFAMVQGIDQDVKGVIFIGYHAMAGTNQAILDHTWAGRVNGVWLNDRPVGEVGLNAAVCGFFGAPLVMVSGDQAVCAEVVDLVGQAETVIVKKTTSRFSAEHLTPKLSQELIKGAATRAVQRLAAGDAPAPFKVSEPVKLIVAFNSSHMADDASLMPGSLRLDGPRVSFEAPDMLTAYRAFQGLVSLTFGS